MTADLTIGALEDLWVYLNAEAEMMAKYKRDNGLVYVSISDFVRQEGEPFWTLAQLPDEWRGEQRMCFMNAFRLMQDHPELTYVEGYADRILAVPHAWCVNEANEIIESTWDPPGDAYFGVRFSREEVYQTVLRRERYGVIDDWESGFPMLQKKRRRT